MSRLASHRDSRATRASRRRDRRAAWIGAALLLASATAGNAAEDAGTLSPFARGAGSRAVGMAGAFVAIADDPSALIWNPGGLARVSRFGVMMDYARFQESETGEQFAALVAPSWRFGTVGVAIRHWGVSGIDRRDDRNVAIAGDLSAGETEIALGYGRAIAPGFGLGGTVKLERAGIGDLSGSGYGADLGASLDAGELLGDRATWAAPFSLGIAVRNAVQPAQRLDRESVPDPRLYRLGLAWRRDLPGFLALHLGAGLERATGLAPRLQIGTEVELRGTMTIRTGLDDGRLAAGTSIHWSGLSIDYAYEQKDLGSTQRVGISKSIGPSVSQRREAARIAEEVNLTERLDQAYERRMADQLNTWLARASEAQAAGRIDEALEAVAAARAIAPTDARAQELEADLLRANAAKLEAAGDPAGAALAYGRALEAWPGDSLAVAGRRRAEAELSRRASRSKHAGEVDRAYALFVSGDLIGAQAALRKLHDVMPGDSATTALLDRVETTLDERRSQCMARARRDLEAGRLDEAARGLDEARRLGVPDSEIAALQDALDRERRKADDHREAPRPVARVTAPAGPTEAQRREADQDYRRGVDLAAAGRTDQALRFWEIAFTLDPDHRGVRRALEREYLLRGMVAFGRGRFAEAETHWARAVELDPSDARARGYLERARTQLERTRELTRTGR